MESIKARWSLPENYLKFLQKSPNNIYLEEEKYGEIKIYGANGLLSGQDGYSYNPRTNHVIEDWNPNNIVIGNSMGDPFCIDISLEKSPVYFARHGRGEWVFKEVYESLEELLGKLL